MFPLEHSSRSEGDHSVNNVIVNRGNTLYGLLRASGSQREHTEMEANGNNNHKCLVAVHGCSNTIQLLVRLTNCSNIGSACLATMSSLADADVKPKTICANGNTMRHAATIMMQVYAALTKSFRKACTEDTILNPGKQTQ